MKLEKKSIVELIMYSIMILIGMFFLTIIPLFFTVLIGGIHYITLIITIAVVLSVFLTLKVFRFFQTNRHKIIFASIACLAILVSAISPIKHAYTSSIPTVDAEVDIYAYEPFSDSNEITILDDKSTLKLQDNLPKLDGATALYPLYSAFVQATYPEKEYNPYDSEVMVNTTPDAYDNLMKGEVDMIFAAGPSVTQMNVAKQKGLELKLTPIGREAFVFFVNQKNKVDGLSLEQIKSIYAGNVTNWEEVGGDDDKIRAFQRPADSGSQTTLEKLMGDTPIMEAPSEDIASGMGGIINEVSKYKNYKNSIGYTFRFYSTEMVRNDQIRLLEIDGVAPTKETIRSGTYPITSEFYIVTAGTDNPNVEILIDWILSPQGQQLLEKAGYVPIAEQ